MADGSSVPIDDNYILESIVNPQAHIVANYTGAMPTFQGQLKPREIEAVIRFIKRMDEVVDENGNLIE